MADIKAFWQQFWRREGGEKKNRDRWMLLALFGVLLLVVLWPVGGKEGKKETQTADLVDKNDETAYNYADRYAAHMESRLKEILEKVEGAGTIQVMITLKNSGEQVVEKDSTYTENKTAQAGDSGQSTTADNISRSESTVYDSTSGGSRM